MIRIVAGTYGYMGKDGFLQPKTAADPPFTLSPDEEERLVNLGVAEKVQEEGDAPSASKTRSKRTSEKSS